MTTPPSLSINGRLLALLALAAAVGAGSLGLISVGEAAAAPPCPNDAFRVGPAANLPDCRAYELVSVPDSGGKQPLAKGGDVPVSAFDAPRISVNGDAVTYQTAQGALPGFDGNGTTDRYEATRGASGWTTVAMGPTGEQMDGLQPGGISADLSSFFVQSKTFPPSPPRGTLAGQFDTASDWVRMPDGQFSLLAQGSLGEEAISTGWLITPGATHILFSTVGANLFTPVRLEPNAGPPGKVTIYDRSFGGPTKVVSLLPGNVPLTNNACFLGASSDGTIVAFTTNSDACDGSVGSQSGSPDPSLYVRTDGQTYQATPNVHTFAGIYGGQVFYENVAPPFAGDNVSPPGDLFSFNPATQQTTQITNVGDARFVNISDDGSRVYFISSSQINGQGAAGQPNLYLWDRGSDSTTYVTTVSDDDVTGNLSAQRFDSVNMTAWIGAHEAGPTDEAGGRALSTTRSTPDGSVLVFEAKAQLTSYDNAGFPQVYRYDANSNQIDCPSCVGAGPATGAARLQTFAFATEDFSRPLPGYDSVHNVSDDGNTVVFEADAGLVTADTNNQPDVYEWTKDGGLHLITTGHATAPSYLYDVSPDASDIVVSTPENLVPINQNGSTPALYDARVDGGIAAQFATPPPPCVGDACQGSLTPPPAAPTAASVTFFGPGNTTSPSSGSTPGKVRVLTKAVRGARFSVKVGVPAKGRITITGAGIRRVQQSVGKAGTYLLAVALSKGAGRTLERKHKLQLRIRVTFAPAGAHAMAATVSITVRQAPQRRRKRSTHAARKDGGTR